jgi:hypothetical protein
MLQLILEAEVAVQLQIMDLEELQPKVMVDQEL